MKPLVRGLFLGLCISLLAGINTFGQTTIASQDFETTPATPTWAFTANNIGSPGSSTGYSTGATTTSDAPASANLFSGGTRGYRVQGASATVGQVLTFDSINTSSYSSIQCSFRIAGMSIGSSGNGMDNNVDVDVVDIEVFNGASWYKQGRVAVTNNNVRWSFGATGSGTRSYQANNSYTTFNTTGTGTITSGTTAITTVTVTDLPAISNLMVRITMQCNASNESWIIDDVLLTGTSCTAPSTPTTANPSAVCEGIAVKIKGAGSTGATSYSFWTASTGGSQITTGTTPPGTVAGDSLLTPTSLAAGTYTYYVQGDKSGCSSTRKAVTVTIHSRPSTPSCTTPLAACTGTSATITGAGTNATSFTYWDASTGGNQITTGNPTGTVVSGGNLTTPTTLTTGTYIYYVQGENTNCVSSNRQAVTVAISNGPTTPTCTTPVYACSGSSATITGAGAGGSATYTYWTASSGGTQITTGNPAGTTVSGGNLTTPNTLGVGTTSYFVQGEVGTCYSTRQQVDVIVQALPSDPPNPTGLNTACNSTSLSIASPPGGVTYFWQGTTNGGSSPSSANSSSSYTANVSGSNTYYVRARDNSTLCWSASATAGSKTVNILTSAPSTPSFSSGATSVCQGSNQTYAINPVTGASGYNWSLSSAGSSSINPNGSSTSTSATVSFDASYTGSATVSVSAENVCGTSSAATRAVTVYAPTTISFTTSTLTNNNHQPCTNTSGLTYQVSPVSGTTYSWSVSGLTGWSVTGGSSTNTVTVTSGTGSGNISVTATNVCGSVTATFAVAPVTSPSAPVANDNISPQTTQVNFTDFTANWDTVVNATAYYVEVSKYSTFSTFSPMSDLIISEYVEGSSNNKYIEIYNGTGSSVNLSNYELRLYSNGSGSATNTTSLSGTLANGSTIVYRDASASIYGGATTTGTATGFNGDDAIALYKLSPAGYVDIFGRIGEDPGSAWTSGPLTTADRTLVRKSSVTSGVTTNPSSGFPTLATEWNDSIMDDVSNLGSHTYSGSTSSFVMGYNGTTLIYDTALLVNGAEIYSDSTYFYRVRAVNACGQSSYSNVVQVTTIGCTPPAAPDGSIGQTPACNSNELVYSPATTPGGISFYWQTTPSGVSLSNAAGGSGLPYTANSTSPIYVRAYNSSTGCWSTTANSLSSGTLTILTVPSQPVVASFTSPVCYAQAGATYSVTSTGATGFNWQYTGDGATVNSSGSSATVDFDSSASSGNLVVTPSNSCGNGTALNISVVVYSNSVSGTTPQTIETNLNGTALTVTETPSAGVTRQWKYSTAAGGPYTNTISGQTGTSYTPNFSSTGIYYVICESTWGGCVVQSNEMVINVISNGPPTITHSSLSNTSSATARTLTATIVSTTSQTCNPYITYRLNGGAWSTANGTNTSGNNWSFTIPGQTSGTLVEYFITACNNIGNTTSPSGVSTSSASGSFHEYQIDCISASDGGTKVVAFQGFEFVGSSGYSFAVNNTSTTPTGLQNYDAHASAIEWGYYNKGPNGSLTATNRNSCGCMADEYSGTPVCPDTTNLVYTSGGSSGFCRTYNGNSRGVYSNSSASTENPSNSRSRNGSYSYIQISRTDNSNSPMSFIYFDDVAIPDPSNATNIKVIAYISSISTGAMTNGADAYDSVELGVKYNSANTANVMVSDITCGSDWYYYSYDARTVSAGSGNMRWDFLGNTYSSSGTVSGTTSKYKLTVSVPNNSTNVRAMLRILNNDPGNNELWAVDDVQIIADYPLADPKRYYRSRQSGKWENSSTWEISDDPTFATGVEDACTPPDYSNSDTIIIKSGTTVRIQSNVTADQVYIAEGGVLRYTTSGVFTLNNAANSVDMVVDGTFEDDATSGNNMVYNSGATWQLGANATIIKTNNSSASGYRENYEGGMVNIPSTAHWYITSIDGATNPTLTTVCGSSCTYYPNLYFTTTSGTWNTGSLGSRFSGSSSYATVKGNLTIGGNTGNVVVYNENSNAQPLLVIGNVIVESGSQFTNNGGTVTNIGTGLEVHGNLTVSGTLTLSSTTTNNTNGILRFGGSSLQTVSGSGDMSVDVLQVQKTAQTIVDLARNVSVEDSLQFTSGVIRTNSYKVTVMGTDRAGAVTGHQAPFTATSGTPAYTNDKYVIGNLERNITSSGIYEFPVGDHWSGEGYNPVRLDVKATSPTGYATAKFITGDPGTFASTYILNFTCAGSNVFTEYTDMTGEGWWNFTSSTGTTFDYDIYLHPNQGNINLYPNDNYNVGGQPVYADNYRALKAPTGSAGSSFDWTNYASGGDKCQVGTYYNIIGAGYSGFSDFAPGGGNGLSTALPVELLYFDAEAVNNSYIQLSWATAIEISNKGFEVQRSTDGMNYNSIGWIDGMGTSSVMQTYFLNDYRVLPEVVYYYRLKQIDFDGDFTYSNIDASIIHNAAGVIISEFYPNPSQGFISVNIKTPQEEKLLISFLNLLGQEVLSNRSVVAAGLNQVNIDGTSLPPSTYQAVITIGDLSLNKRLVITR